MVALKMKVNHVQSIVLLVHERTRLNTRTPEHAFVKKNLVKSTPSEQLK